MVNSRIYVKKTHKTRLVGLRGRVYASSERRPSHLLIDTRCPESKLDPRYPVAEGHFPDAQLQPYVHSCMVKVHEAQREHFLVLLFKNHVRLPVNMSLEALGCTATFRGDIIVMRPAAKNPRSFVNLRGRDSVLSDFAVHKFVEYISQNPRCRTPRFLEFRKSLVSGQRRSSRKNTV